MNALNNYPYINIIMCVLALSLIHLFGGGLNAFCHEKFDLIEIDSIKFNQAKMESGNDNIAVSTVYDNDSICSVFLHTVMLFDEQVKDILESIPVDSNTDADGEFAYSLNRFCWDGDSVYVLEFRSPIWRFLYLATLSSNDELLVCHSRIESAPCAFSTIGLVAGFKETIDALYVDSKIYRFSLCKDEAPSIIELFHIENSGQGWCVSIAPMSVFWYNDSLFIRGRKRVGENGEGVCFFQVSPVREGLEISPIIQLR